MNVSTPLKAVCLFTLTTIVAACSSTPKVPLPEPKLDAAIVVPPPSPIVNTPRGPSLTLDDVLFDFEESTLRPDAATTISQAATYMNENPERVALVEGHTDAIGDENFNQSLSVDRANAIRSALLAQGISDSRIKPTGMGESQPIADNDTDTGRQNNRRVEIIFKLKEEIQ